MGGTGSDSIVASGKGSTLVANAGDDTLVGGAGADKFIFKQLTADTGIHHHVVDMSRGGADTMVLGGTGEDLLKGGTIIDVKGFNLAASVLDDSALVGASYTRSLMELGTGASDKNVGYVTYTNGANVITLAFQGQSAASVLKFNDKYPQKTAPSLNSDVGEYDGRSVNEMVEITGLSGKSNKIVASKGGSRISGAGNGDTMVGNTGDDRIEGLAGADKLYSGAAIDGGMTLGSTAVDAANMGGGNDTLIGGKGNDSIYVGNVLGADSKKPQKITIYGDDEKPNDTDTGVGDDVISVGEVGKLGDTLASAATAFKNTLDVYAGGGNDNITVAKIQGAASVNINGEAGNDNITVTSGITDAATVNINGGDGDDHVVLNGVSSLANVKVDLGAGTNQISTGNLAGKAKVTVTGGAGTDSVTVGTVSDTANISISTGKGNDSINVGAVSGGTVNVDMGEAEATGGNKVTVGNLSGKAIVSLKGGSGADSMSIGTVGTGSADSVQVSMDGGDGDNKFYVGAGAEKANVRITGGKGNDTFYLNYGNTSSTEKFVLDESNASVKMNIQGGAIGTGASTTTNEIVISSGTGGADVKLTGAKFANINKVKVDGSNASTIDVTGSGTITSVVGGGGAYLIKAKGAQNISAGGGADSIEVTLVGGKTTTVNAGEGNDTIKIAATNVAGTLAVDGGGQDVSGADVLDLGTVNGNIVFAAGSGDYEDYAVIKAGQATINAKEMETINIDAGNKTVNLGLTADALAKLVGTTINVTNYTHSDDFLKAVDGWTLATASGADEGKKYTYTKTDGSEVVTITIDKVDKAFSTAEVGISEEYATATAGTALYGSRAANYNEANLASTAQTAKAHEISTIANDATGTPPQIPADHVRVTVAAEATADKANTVKGAAGDILELGNTAAGLKAVYSARNATTGLTTLTLTNAKGTEGADATNFTDAAKGTAKIALTGFNNLVGTAKADYIDASALNGFSYTTNKGSDTYKGGAGKDVVTVTKDDTAATVVADGGGGTADELNVSALDVSGKKFGLKYKTNSTTTYVLDNGDDTAKLQSVEFTNFEKVIGKEESSAAASTILLNDKGEGYDRVKYTFTDKGGFKVEQAASDGKKNAATVVDASNIAFENFKYQGAGTENTTYNYVVETDKLNLTLGAANGTVLIAAKNAKAESEYAITGNSSKEQTLMFNEGSALTAGVTMGATTDALNFGQVGEAAAKSSLKNFKGVTGTTKDDKIDFSAYTSNDLFYETGGGADEYKGSNAMADEVVVGLAAGKKVIVDGGTKVDQNGDPVTSNQPVDVLNVSALDAGAGKSFSLTAKTENSKTTYTLTNGAAAATTVEFTGIEKVAGKMNAETEAAESTLLLNDRTGENNKVEYTFTADKGLKVEQKKDSGAADTILDATGMEFAGFKYQGAGTAGVDYTYNVEGTALDLKLGAADSTVKFAQGKAVAANAFTIEADSTKANALVIDGSSAVTIKAIADALNFGQVGDAAAKSSLKGFKTVTGSSGDDVIDVSAYTANNLTYYTGGGKDNYKGSNAMADEVVISAAIANGGTITVDGGTKTLTGNETQPEDVLNVAALTVDNKNFGLTFADGKFTLTNGDTNATKVEFTGIEKVVGKANADGTAVSTLVIDRKSDDTTTTKLLTNFNQKGGFFVGTGTVSYLDPENEPVFENFKYEGGSTSGVTYGFEVYTDKLDLTLKAENGNQVSIWSQKAVAASSIKIAGVAGKTDSLTFGPRYEGQERTPKDETSVSLVFDSGNINFGKTKVNGSDVTLSSLTNFKNVTGTSKDDTFTFNAATTGLSSVNGGDGADTFDLQKVKDSAITLNGGADNDTFKFNAVGDGAGANKGWTVQTGLVKNKDGNTVTDGADTYQFFGCTTKADISDAAKQIEALEKLSFNLSADKTTLTISGFYNMVTDGAAGTDTQLTFKIADAEGTNATDTLNALTNDKLSFYNGESAKILGGDIDLGSVLKLMSGNGNQGEAKHITFEAGTGSAAGTWQAKEIKTA